MSRSVEQISNTEALCCSAALHLTISGNKQEKEDEKALEQQPSIECAFQLVQGNKETIHEIDDFGSFLLQFSFQHFTKFDLPQNHQSPIRRLSTFEECSSAAEGS
ncbi:unnamed protein product [Sphagnum jensenii]|uniref:Uncharacterized protein n=1 Tax=Sphagnum jensenii TaxID=128206 RepID=A0ABP1ACB8_9BRYO